MNTKYTRITTDSFGLFDENGICRTWFSSYESRERNLSKLYYEEYCCRLSSKTLEYAENRIKSWYIRKKINASKETKMRNNKHISMFMRIGYL